MSRWGRARHGMREFLWGLVAFDIYAEDRKLSIPYNDAVSLLVSSEPLGIPLMNSYVSMRLLPCFVGQLEGWMRRGLQERDLLVEAPDPH